MKRPLSVVIVWLMVLAGAARGELTPEQERHAQALITKLGDDRHAVRRKATEELIAMGYEILPLVTRTLAETDDPEVKMRCRKVLAGIKLRERVVQDLGARPENVEEILRNRTRNTLLCIFRRGEKYAIFRNGKEEPVGEFSRLVDRYMTGSPGGVAYIVSRNGSQIAVCRDWVSPEYKSAYYLRMSSDGKHFAFLATREGRRFIVHDGKELPSYEGHYGINLSEDGRRILCGVKRNGRWVMMIDGSEGPEHDRVFPHGPYEKARYVAIDGNEVWLCHIDLPPAGVPVPKKLVEKKIRLMAKLDPGFAHANLYPVAASDHFLILRAFRVGCMVYYEGKKVGSYQRCLQHVVSRDGRHLACEVGDLGPRFVVHDKTESGPYKGVQDMTFSPDGKRLAYGAVGDRGWFVVRDGKPGKMHLGRVAAPTFSPDGKRLAYRVEQGGRWWIVLDGKEFGPYDRKRSPRRSSRVIRVTGRTPPERPVFSPDGKHLAWIGVRGVKQFVVCDGREGPAYLSLSTPRFSPDSRHLIYHAQKRAEGAQPEARVMVVDGIESPASPNVIPPHSFDPLKRLQYITVHDNRFKRVEVNWPEGLDWTNGLKPASEDKP